MLWVHGFRQVCTGHAKPDPKPQILCRICEQDVGSEHESCIKRRCCCPNFGKVRDPRSSNIPEQGVHLKFLKGSLKVYSLITGCLEGLDTETLNRRPPKSSTLAPSSDECVD